METVEGYTTFLRENTIYQSGNGYVICTLDFCAVRYKAHASITGLYLLCDILLHEAELMIENAESNQSLNVLEFMGA